MVFLNGATATDFVPTPVVDLNTCTLNANNENLMWRQQLPPADVANTASVTFFCVPA